jgi:hypothetical protein
MSDEAPDVESVESVDVESSGVDVCPTPVELALAICGRLGVLNNLLHATHGTFKILEPSAGDGAFVAAARQTWPDAQIVAVEPRLECHDKLLAAGATHAYTLPLEDLTVDAIHDVDLIVGNPPFSLADQHIRRLLGNMHDGAILAFLLRFGFYEARKSTRGMPLEARLALWSKYPEISVAPIYPRPGFVLNSRGKRGTDAQIYGLFTWRAGADPNEVVSIRDKHITWVPPPRAARAKRGPRQNPATGDCTTCEAVDGPGAGNPWPCSIHTTPASMEFDGFPVEDSEPKAPPVEEEVPELE